jgi:polyphosphate kinase 2 (PPK2 family)
MAHFLAAREIVVFDRSWYNPAGVEQVMGFCTEEQDRKGSFHSGNILRTAAVSYPAVC